MRDRVDRIVTKQGVVNTGANQRHGGDTTDRSLAVARDIGLCLMAPLSVLDVRPADLRRWQIESYVLGVCSALTSLVPDPNTTEPIFQPY